jgi:hypothetical protein
MISISNFARQIERKKFKKIEQLKFLLKKYSIKEYKIPNRYKLIKNLTLFKKVIPHYHRNSVGRIQVVLKRHHIRWKERLAFFKDFTQTSNNEEEPVVSVWQFLW